jgi:hypothetical protein
LANPAQALENRMVDDALLGVRVRDETVDWATHLVNGGVLFTA